MCEQEASFDWLDCWIERNGHEPERRRGLQDQIAFGGTDWRSLAIYNLPSIELLSCERQRFWRYCTVGHVYDY